MSGLGEKVPLLGNVIPHRKWHEEDPTYMNTAAMITFFAVIGFTLPALIFLFREGDWEIFGLVLGFWIAFGLLWVFALTVFFKYGSEPRNFLSSDVSSNETVRDEKFSSILVQLKKKFYVLFMFLTLYFFTFGIWWGAFLVNHTSYIYDMKNENTPGLMQNRYLQFSRLCGAFVFMGAILIVCIIQFTAACSRANKMARGIVPVSRTETGGYFIGRYVSVSSKEYVSLFVLTCITGMLNSVVMQIEVMGINSHFGFGGLYILEILLVVEWIIIMAVYRYRVRHSVGQFAPEYISGLLFWGLYVGVNGMFYCYAASLHLGFGHDLPTWAPPPGNPYFSTAQVQFGMGAGLLCFIFLYLISHLNLDDAAVPITGLRPLSGWISHVYTAIVGGFYLSLFIVFIMSLNGWLGLNHNWDSFKWIYTGIGAAITVFSAWIVYETMKELKKSTNTDAWVVVLFNRLLWSQVITYFQMITLFWVMDDKFPRFGGDSHIDEVKQISNQVSYGWYNLCFTAICIIVSVLYILFDLASTKYLSYVSKSVHASIS